MKKPKPVWHWLLIAAAAILAVAVAIPFLVPLSSFIPELEQAASQGLGQPVRIGELKIRLVPTPRAVASTIRAGKKDEVSIGELEIVPEIASLFSTPRVIRLIRAERIELKEAALAFPGAMPKGDPGNRGQPLQVRRIALEKLKLQHPTLRLPEMDLDIKLGEGHTLEVIRLAAADVALELTVAAAGTRAANAKLGGTLYGGTVAVSTRLDWSKQWHIEGKAKLAGVDLVPVQQLLGKKPKLSGRLKADAGFSARARTPEHLANALSLDGPFEVLGGAYHGMDLSKAGELTVGKLPSGGSTRFDELKGKLQLRGKRTRVNELCMRSQYLVAGGYVEIAPDEKLSGKLDVSVSNTKGFVGVPVALAGTTTEPSVSLTRGAMLGALVGTVVLPGIGTGLGASAGSALEGRSDCN